MPEIINLENVCFSYPGAKKNALDAVSLSVTEGEFLAVMGENGAGKTTFCKLFNGLVPHFTGGNFYGSVTVDGERTDISCVARLAVKVGMVMDDPDAQLFTPSVRHEAAFGPENLLVPALEIEQRVSYALSAVGLKGFEDRQPSMLSGGEKQRLAIAAALTMNAKILVLDEPLCRLDPQGVDEVMAVLKDLREKAKITVIMTAHDSGRMAQAADRVCVLKDGKIASCDTPDKIFKNFSLLDECGIKPPYTPDIKSVFTENAICSTVPSPLHEEAIKLENVSFSYGKAAVCLENISLTIKNNEFTAIIGRNGCGKTTLLKCVTGLLRPREGNIFIRGRNVKELTDLEISKEIGFVMQNPDSQLFTDSVYKEVSFALKNAAFKNAKLSKQEIKCRVEEAIKTAGLDDTNAFPHALNKAERTMTIIACVLAMGCKIVILDEADAAQDYRGMKKIMNIAKDLHSKGFTVIFVTHNISLACEYAQRLIIMEKNGIISDGVRKK